MTQSREFNIITNQPVTQQLFKRTLPLIPLGDRNKLFTYKEVEPQKPRNYDYLKTIAANDIKNSSNIQSTNYDIITNSQRLHDTCRQNYNGNFLKNQTISKIVNANHTYHPHMRQDFRNLTENGFFKRQNGECSQMIEMKKSYGVKKIFRKYK